MNQINAHSVIKITLYDIAREQNDDSFVYDTTKDRKYFYYHKLNIKKFYKLTMQEEKNAKRK